MPSYTESASPIYNGEPFWAGVDQASISSISKVSLIRPGAPTHGFDQSQRYVSAAFTKDVAKKRVRVVVHSDPDVLPPGDYLFVSGQVERRAIGG